MKFLVHDKELFKKYNKVWNRIKDLFGKEFNSKPVFVDIYIKAKIKSQITNFQGNEISIMDNNPRIFSVIALDSIFNVDEKDFLQIFLKDVNIKIKKINLIAVFESLWT